MPREHEYGDLTGVNRSAELYRNFPLQVRWQSILTPIRWNAFNMGNCL